MRLSRNGDIVRRWTFCHRQREGCRKVSDAGKSRDAGQRLVEKRTLAFGRIILARRKVDLCLQNVFGVEAEVEVGYGNETPHHQARKNKEQQGKRHLANDQSSANAGTAPRTVYVYTSALQIRATISPPAETTLPSAKKTNAHTPQPNPKQDD